MKRMLLVFAVLLLAGCTTSSRIMRPDGSIEYLVACGAATGWNICYNKANDLCPTGWETIGENAGFNRKELRISCPGEVESESTEPEQAG